MKDTWEFKAKKQGNPHVWLHFRRTFQVGTSLEFMNTSGAYNNFCRYHCIAMPQHVKHHNPKLPVVYFKSWALLPSHCNDISVTCIPIIDSKSILLILFSQFLLPQSCLRILCHGHHWLQVEPAVLDWQHPYFWILHTISWALEVMKISGAYNNCCSKIAFHTSAMKWFWKSIRTALPKHYKNVDGIKILRCMQNSKLKICFV